MERSFDKVVVKLQNYNAEMSSFVRLRIPLNTVEELSIKKAIDPRTFYVRHGLDPCSPLDLVYVDAPFSTNNAAVSIRSFIYSFDNHSPLYLVGDLSQSPSDWNVSNLPFKMTITNVLSVDEKIYLFVYEKRGVLSAYAFDLDRREWERLPLPILDDSNINVISLGEKILLLFVKNQLVYDPRLLTWTPVDYKGLLLHCNSMLDHPITVEEHNSIYWLDPEFNIRAFDYQLSKHYYGPIVGFAHEPIVRRGRCPGAVPLIHVTGGLFCIVWKNNHTNDLHLTLLHVSRGPKVRSSYVTDYHLFVNVVSCFHHRIDPNLLVDGAYKLSS